MASTKREIKTTLSLDGEREFKDAISDSKGVLKVLGSELKELTSAYKLNGDQMGYLKSKAEVLDKELKKQEEIVELTAAMYQKAAAGGEEFVGKAQKLNVQLNNSKAALNRLKAEIQATDREMEELGRDSISAGRDIERGLTDAAQDASREIKDMVTETEGSLGKMKSLFSGGVGITATIGAVVGVGVGAFNTLAGLAEEGAEYTLTVGKLRANAEMQGADWDYIQGEMLRVTAITGEADVAVQGISSILNTGVQDAQTLTTLVDMLLGATIKYTDLDFGGVATDLQKTVSQRQAIGSIADILTDMNYDIEDINKELANAETDAAALNIVMGYLADGGLHDVYKNYYKINEEIINSKISQGRLNDEIKTLGSNIGVWHQPVFDTLADLTGVLNDVITGEKDIPQALSDAANIINNSGAGGMFQGLASAAVFHGKGGALNIVGDAAVKALPEEAKAATDETMEILENFENEGEEWGKRVGATLYDTVIEELWNAYNAIADRVGAINQLMASLGSGSGRTGAGAIGSTAGGGGVVINMELDGKRMGSALVPYIDGAMGRQTARTNLG